MKAWYEIPTTVQSVAEWAVEQGECLTTGDLLRFFEKPHRYDDWYTAWENDQAKQGEHMDEARGRL